MRMFVWEIEDALMNLKSERINTNTMYQKNEIIADAWDEYEACIDREVIHRMNLSHTAIRHSV